MQGVAKVLNDVFINHFVILEKVNVCLVSKGQKGNIIFHIDKNDRPSGLNPAFSVNRMDVSKTPEVNRKAKAS